jgi:hypothetical protein
MPKSKTLHGAQKRRKIKGKDKRGEKTRQDKDKEERRREENGTGEKRNLASLLVVYKVRFCLWQLVHRAIGFAEDLRKLLQLWNQMLMLCDCKSSFLTLYLLILLH